MYIVHIYVHIYIPHVQNIHTHIYNTCKITYTHTHGTVKHLVVHVFVSEAQALLISHS